MSEVTALPRLPAVSLDPHDAITRERAWSQVQAALQEYHAFTVELSMDEVGRQAVEVLLGLLDLPEPSLWRVARRSVRPDSTFEWVGYGYHRQGSIVLHETFDLGPWGAAAVDEALSSDRSGAEVTPLPSDLASGWLAAADGLRVALGGVGRDLVSLIAWGLGLNPSVAASRFKSNESTLRILNYPAVEQHVAVPLRAAEHEDSGGLTFIWSDAPGLQVLTSRDDWVEVSPLTWTVICGHVASEMTAGAVSATTHRVVPGHGRRRSVAYFFEPDRSASVTRWPPSGDEDAPYGQDQAYGAWLARRHGA
ncbi:2OG-Fe(II) oxygenase family protein [Micromonospora saelicesensis]|uniref:2OG-Fe(II) oxygenase family protein n=1 Tax=Micromonospora saelicesensis TaxID=285676 RepID=UPI003D89EF1B